MKICIINGPNLNLLGTRETEIYGNKGFETFYEDLKSEYPNIAFKYFQSNIEGEIIDHLQKEGFSADGILLNAAAYTHTSVGIADAIKTIDSPVIEIHISNIYSREEYRKKSITSEGVHGLICGFGGNSYLLGIEAICKLIYK